MAQSESPLSDSLSDPSLSQNVSFKRLNDQAAEFVPSPTLIAPASAPAAPLAAVGQVHVYPPPWPSGPFHVPIQVVPPPPPPHVVPGPVHHHHHLPKQKHQHHQQQLGKQS
ncbi:hypothetical protein ACFX13_023144 [Malus domestica]